jgi:hypothetical protein
LLPLPATSRRSAWSGAGFGVAAKVAVPLSVAAAPLPAEPGGHGVGRGAVQVVAGAVVAAGGARVGVIQGVLDVAQRRAAVQGDRGVGVAQAVRAQPVR